MKLMLALGSEVNSDSRDACLQTLGNVLIYFS